MYCPWYNTKIGVVLFGIVLGAYSPCFAAPDPSSGEGNVKNRQEKVDSSDSKGSHVEVHFGDGPTDEEIEALRFFKGLDRLSIGCSSIGDLQFKRLCEVVPERLRCLEVKGSEIRPSGWAPLRRLRHLRHLVMRSNWDITDESLKFLEALPRLERLTVSGSGITDDGLAVIGKCPKLSFLALDGTSVRGPGLGYLKNCKNLYELSIGGVKFDDSEVHRLNEFPQLEYLSLCHTSVTAVGIASLTNLTELRFLSLPQQVKAKNLVGSKQFPALEKVWRGEELVESQ